MESVNFTHTNEVANTKGFVVADLQLDGRRIRLVNTHFDSSSDISRSSEIVQLTDYLFARTDTCDQTLICGDLNVCPQTRDEGGFDDGSQYAHLQEEFGRLHLGDVWGSDSEGTHQKATLDHVFFDPNAWSVHFKQVVSISNLEGLAASDHRGLEVTLTW